MPRHSKKGRKRIVRDSFEEIVLERWFFGGKEQKEERQKKSDVVPTTDFQKQTT